MKIFLEEPITISGIEVRLTYEGLKYQIAKHESFLETARPDQLGNKEREHIKSLIEKYQQHLILYEREQGSTEV